MRRPLIQPPRTPVLAAVAAAALVAAGLVVAALNDRAVEAQRHQDAVLRARILAASVTAALAFDDVDGAREYVGALSTDPDLLAAGVYDAEGHLFVGLDRAAATMPERWSGHAGADPSGLVVTAPVVQSGVPLGMVYLNIRSEQWLTRVGRYALVALLGVMAALVVAVLGFASTALARANLDLENRVRLRTHDLEDANERLRARTAQLDTIMETAPAVVWLAEGRDAATVTGTRYAAELLRMPPGTNQSKTGPMDAADHFAVRVAGEEIPPADLPLQRAARGDTVYNEELEVAFDDGTSVHLLMNAAPVRNRDGEVEGAVGAAIDISARKQLERQQALLMAELDHRVKNILALVKAIAAQSLPRQTPGRELLSSRIDVLASAHNLLAETKWTGARMGDLVEAVLAPYLTPLPLVLPRGPDVHLSARAAQSLCLALHELATNAVKYGALAAAQGRVHLEWSVQSGEALPFRIVWREVGGPRVQVPERTGFGQRMIRGSVEYELAGAARLDFLDEGLLAVFELPETALATPLPRGAPPRSKSPAATAPDATGLHGRRVLVVEDVLATADAIAAHLRHLGCEVVGPVPRLPAALRLAGTEALHPAVLDVNLGGEMVWPAADVLRTRGVPILLLTGYDASALPAAWRDTPRLGKPADEPELTAALVRLLADRPQTVTPA